jgi:putative transposase
MCCKGRFKAILLEKETHLLELVRYVALNPVRARAVRSARDGPWSSYRATAGIVEAPDFLTTSWILGEFHRSPRRAIELYREFVKQGHSVNAWAELRGGILLGSEEFADKLKPLLSHTLQAVADFLGLHPSTLSMIAKRIAESEKW